MPETPRIIRYFIQCLAVAAAALPSATSTAVFTMPPAEAIAAQFEAVAFGHEHGTPLGALQKWDGPIRMAFFKSPSVDAGSTIAAVEGHLPLISALTGLDFRPSLRFDDATLRVGVIPRAQFRELAATPADAQASNAKIEQFLSTSACIAVAASSTKELGRIEQGTVVIGSDVSASLQRHCILEEMVQVLGLPNDACLYRPSLFCEDDHVMEPTAADRVLVRALYDQRLSSGMTPDTAMPLVRTIVARALTGDGA